MKGKDRKREGGVRKGEEIRMCSESWRSSKTGRVRGLRMEGLREEERLGIISPL